MTAPLNPVAQGRTRIASAGVPLLVVSMVVIMVVPLPGPIIDLLLAVSISLSIMILLTAMMVKEALEFSVFPTLLLITTLFRLALNVSTTRLILSGNGESKIIETFGQFVIGGNVVIGLVIFLILVVIQFAVITTGAGRVAEVSARFILDAMPGKQMAVDADLNSGLIDDNEARRRRLAISREADFYGSMDGASKFVKGDAIAGVVIVLINLLGGIAIGFTQLDLGLGEAALRFSLLTVGDGLVSQVPALLVSVASGVIVTRAVTDEGGGLGTDVWGQLLADRQTLAMASGAVLVLGMVPGLPKVPFLLLAAGLGFAALRRPRRGETGSGDGRANAGPAVAGAPGGPAPAGGDDTTDRLVEEMRVDALALELSSDLLDLVDRATGSLLPRVRTLRRHVAMDLGLVIPLVRTSDNLTLPQATYVIKVHGVEAGRGEAPMGQVLVLAAQPEVDLPGRPTTEPVYGLPAAWVAEHLGPQLEAMGHSVIDRTSVILTHLSEVIRQRAADLLSRQDVHDLVEAIRESAPSLANEIGNEGVSYAQLHQVLAALLREGVPVRDFTRIVEAVSTAAGRSRDVDNLVEAARRALGPAICAQLAVNGRLPALTFDPMLEQQLLEAVRPGESGAFLALNPKVTEQLLDSAILTVAEVENRGDAPVLVCSAQLRPILRRLFASSLPNLAVLSFNELSPALSLNPVGVINVDANAAAV
jgi:flagellar biosynthesis protein FlhA